MHLPAIATAALLALAPFSAQAQPYKASGTEPFWSLTIGARTMRFESPGRRPVEVAAPRVIHGFAGEMWQTRRINVNTVHRPCSDGMSDRSFADTVTVTVDGRTYKGCGGDVTAAVPTGSLLDGNWRVAAINGRPVARGTHPTVRFAEGRVNGNAGCNAFGGSFTFARGRLSVGRVISTRMACVDPLRGPQERAILDLFAERLSVSSNRNGKLVLTSPRGRTMTLVRDGH